MGKHSILGVMIDAVDYSAAVADILMAAKEGRPYAVSALAVHGTMVGVLDSEQRYRMNHCELVVPDGQPVRWALNWLYGLDLCDRVYGPRLVLEVLAEAAETGLPVFLYGSTAQVMESLIANVRARFPRLLVAGAEASCFRPLNLAERDALVKRIASSGARIVMAGLGCPRQETFAYEMRSVLSMPVLAIGAAFPFLAGTLPQAPEWMQRRGLEWAYRLFHEPGRLWKRPPTSPCAPAALSFPV
jgi:exopolysaccharide biosynthesis WecB/TagA/CpsF family protein